MVPKIISVVLFATLVIGSPAEAVSEDKAIDAREFQKIEQPLGIKLAVILGGLGAIGLELWWFLWSQPERQTATLSDGGQDITITVDGGYDPDRIEVLAGQPVRLHFLRKDPSSCLEKVVLPDFRMAADLKLNEITTVEFTPQQPGQYNFQCGMNMFRGAIDVKSKKRVGERFPERV